MLNFNLSKMLEKLAGRNHICQTKRAARYYLVGRLRPVSETGQVNANRWAVPCKLK
jgi:hypothetical protein